MASNLNQFEFFNFFTRYRWRPEDFEAFENLTRFMTQAGNRFASESVVRGYSFSSATGFSLTVAAGLAFDLNGFPLHKSSSTSGISVSAPTVGESRWTLIVARKKTTDINPIQEPTNPSNTVFLNTTEETEIVAINGVLDANPVYPAKLAGDVILMGLKLPSGASEILSTYVDYSVTEYPFKNGDQGKYLSQFDAVVGDSRFITHRSLNDVMADANIANIKTIFVRDSAVLNEIQELNQPDKRIIFGPGVTYSKGTAATGVLAQASGIQIEYGRFSGFNGGSDAAIGYETGADYGCVTATRFNDCQNELIDNTINGIAAVSLQTEV